MSAADPSHRALIARIAACTRWAHETDRTAATAAARRASADRFERQVDPDGALPPDERARRADSARLAHMSRMALRSAQVRATRVGKRAAA